MKVFKEKQIVASGLVFAGIIFFIVASQTDVIEGGADNYAHYNISRWIFKHPYLIFDLWGKPVFTLFSAPFAQAGFIGVRFFNIICGLITAWFGYKIALKLNLKYSWLVTVCIIFIPIYIVMITSGMTEILFSLILLMAVYYFFSDKFILSSVILSFLFLVRIEGLAFSVLFLVGFLVRRKYWPIPFLAAGFLIFSIIGSVFQFNDILWLIHNRPYARGGDSVYGSGSIWHYFITMPFYLGYPALFLLLAGTIFLMFRWYKARFNVHSGSFPVLLLIAGCFYGYAAIHSFLWWKGETSVGLLRVMAGVAPLTGIISLAGINELVNFIKNKTFVWAVIAVICCLHVFSGIRYYHKMAKLVDLSSEVLNRATNWIKSSGSLKHKIVVHDPYFAFSTGVDPWDNRLIQFGFSSGEFPETGLPDSTIFIWDAHFSSNESKMPVEKIIANKNFQLIRKFEPENPFTVLGGYEYKILIFRKITPLLIAEESMQVISTEVIPGYKIIYRKGYDFETATGDINIDSRIEADERKGSSRYYKLGSEMEFGPGFVLTTNQLNIVPESIFKISTDVFSDIGLKLRQVLLVFSIEKGNKSCYYSTYDFGEKTAITGEWLHIEKEFKVPEPAEKGLTVKIYVWNIDKTQIFIDNFFLEVFEEKL